MSKDEQRRSKLPGDVAEDNPALSESRSRKEKAGTPSKTASPSVLSKKD